MPGLGGLSAPGGIPALPNLAGMQMPAVNPAAGLSQMFLGNQLQNTFGIAGQQAIQQMQMQQAQLQAYQQQQGLTRMQALAQIGYSNPQIAQTPSFDNGMQSAFKMAGLDPTSVPRTPEGHVDVAAIGQSQLQQWMQTPGNMKLFQALPDDTSRLNYLTGAGLLPRGTTQLPAYLNTASLQVQKDLPASTATKLESSAASVESGNINPITAIQDLIANKTELDREYGAGHTDALIQAVAQATLSPNARQKLSLEATTQGLKAAQTQTLTDELAHKIANIDSETALHDVEAWYTKNFKAPLAAAQTQVATATVPLRQAQTAEAWASVPLKEAQTVETKAHTAFEVANTALTRTRREEIKELLGPKMHELVSQAKIANAKAFEIASTVADNIAHGRPPGMRPSEIVSAEREARIRSEALGKQVQALNDYINNIGQTTPPTPQGIEAAKKMVKSLSDEQAKADAADKQWEKAMDSMIQQSQPATPKASPAAKPSAFVTPAGGDNPNVYREVSEAGHLWEKQSDGSWQWLGSAPDAAG